MANSLRDQLLKKGLVDEKKLKKVNNEERKQQKMQRKRKEVSADEVKLAAQQAAAEKAERDRELNRQQKEKAERKAIAAQVVQLIQMNRVSRGEGDIAFNFVDGGKVKRLYVTESLRDQLSQGRLAIVTLAGQYELVPAAVAQKVQQRDEAAVIVLNDRVTPEAEDPDDPYKDFKIPDDLMW